ncbi:alanine aminotransferase 2-like isoform X2 [Stegodyphus dumicola]|uniref:alanine aminotransferase 2-like isoform X2 n=1 Tax=Stegodyphus dumicola TaxID=202533 RepID=UPI0015B1AEE7|nr:alanine aminotransferase 2-like isoform X2 [Stegodyphus dumicola]
MGQKPVTFIRQVMAVCAYPPLLNDSFIPSDVKARANSILDECGGRSAGAYTYSEGIDLIREHIAQYLQRRDGVQASAENVILTAGASEALRIDYFLEEDQEWSISLNELSSALEAASRYCIPRAILVINPGNPTGSVLNSNTMEEIIQFAVRQKLVLLADESYQFNAFGQGCFFQSFKKTMMLMSEPFKHLELVSIMSGSTGILGECGLRCGCCELMNIREDVISVYKKSICVKMCPSVMGQIALDCMIFPPEPHEPSYPGFIQECRDIMQSLYEKATIAINALNEIDGIQCNNYTGSTFVFPKIYIPEKAVIEAKAKGQTPDTFYAMQLLEETGICSVPGALYGQIPGTYHLRLTILPEKEKIQKMAEMIRRFHTCFIQKYS